MLNREILIIPLTLELYRIIEMSTRLNTTHNQEIDSNENIFNGITECNKQKCSSCHIDNQIAGHYNRKANTNDGMTKISLSCIGCQNTLQLLDHGDRYDPSG